MNTSSIISEHNENFFERFPGSIETLLIGYEDDDNHLRNLASINTTWYGIALAVGASREYRALSALLKAVQKSLPKISYTKDSRCELPKITRILKLSSFKKLKSASFELKVTILFKIKHLREQVLKNIANECQSIVATKTLQSFLSLGGLYQHLEYTKGRSDTLTLNAPPNTSAKADTLIYLAKKRHVNLEDSLAQLLHHLKIKKAMALFAQQTTGKIELAKILRNYILSILNSNHLHPDQIQHVFDRTIKIANKIPYKTYRSVVITEITEILAKQTNCLVNQFFS